MPLPYAERLSENVAFVRWNNNANHAAAEVSYGPSGIAPEDGTIISTPLPQCVLPGLEPDSHYTVYVRARCDFAQSEWTDWSEPLDIHLASLGVTAAAGPDITLAPNPAKDEVRIACSHTMQHISIFTSNGAVALTLTPSATEVTLDMRRMPYGTYTVAVSTEAGIATRQLVVE